MSHSEAWVRAQAVYGETQDLEVVEDHILTSWYQQGADVQKLLPQLSVYLGHAHLADTQAYLSMTPELLGEASVRFERYVEMGGQP